VYFDIHKVVDLHLKRLIELRAARWNDEWWTTRRVADHHGVTTNEIKRYIKLGYLPAYRLPISLGGREHDRKWSYWFVLRSHALEVKFINHNAQSAFTPRADAWILKAHDELGMTFNHIGLTMKIGKPLPGGSNKAIVYRYRQLKTLAMQKRGKRK
jgi:hypothetical protein